MKTLQSTRSAAHRKRTLTQAGGFAAEKRLTISIIQQKVLQAYLHLQLYRAAKGTPAIS